MVHRVQATVGGLLLYNEGQEKTEHIIPLSWLSLFINKLFSSWLQRKKRSAADTCHKPFWTFLRQHHSDGGGFKYSGWILKTSAHSWLLRSFGPCNVAVSATFDSREQLLWQLQSRYCPPKVQQLTHQDCLHSLFFVLPWVTVGMLKIQNWKKCDRRK